VTQDAPKDESPESYAQRVGESLARDPNFQPSLEAVAQVLGDRASDVRFVSALLDFLEGHGLDVDAGESPQLAPLLRDVLGSARAIRLEGTPPRVSIIAERLEMEPRLVRVALLYAEVLMRG
jgi:hypothetical protein